MDQDTEVADADPPLDFTPLLSFYAKENDNYYTAGMGYTATTPELKQFVRSWVRRGLVKYGRITSQIGGHGTVT